MKKILSMVLVLGLLLSFVGCSDKQSPKSDSEVLTNNTTTTTTTEPKTEQRDYTFRNSVWGDSIQQVKHIETATFFGENESYLMYEGSISGYSCDIIYQFSDDKLVNGGYYIQDIYTNAGQYIAAYDALKENLYSKYGDATEDEIIKLERDSLIETAGPAKALEYGYVVYRARWETENTDIMLAMMAENFDITLVLTYTDKNYEDTSNMEGI